MDIDLIGRVANIALRDKQGRAFTRSTKRS